jgi:hypothetical protein
MTPEEMANSLCSKILLQIRKYKLISMSMVDDEQIAIDLGLIQIDEILNILDQNLDGSQFKVMNYWNDVKEEIKAL